MIICDIDGTIADLTHRLHYIKGDDRNFDKFYEQIPGDPEIEWVCEVLESLVIATGRKVVFITGRSDIARPQTSKWLKDHLGQGKADLLMRPEGDHRPDYVVKADLLKHYKIKPKDVLCVLEDRKQVVSMYREKGFNVMQVAEGNY